MGGISNIKVNKMSGEETEEQEGPLQPTKITVKPEDYFTHPKIAEDIDDLKTTVNGIADFGEEMGARNYLLKFCEAKFLGVEYPDL
ncbi:hypothetical protein HZA97_08060 [Candidatus Woesearchaeota archaeon]|nr:hypothetical protein [Candidatus Woesearchaeota archaeon]